MAIVLTIDSGDFDSSSYAETQANNQGNPNDIYVKKFSGAGTLSDGSYCSFNFELTKMSSEPFSDITDDSATYTITIDKA